MAQPGSIIFLCSESGRRRTRAFIARTVRGLSRILGLPVPSPAEASTEAAIARVDEAMAADLGVRWRPDRWSFDAFLGHRYRYPGRSVADDYRSLQLAHAIDREVRRLQHEAHCRAWWAVSTTPAHPAQLWEYPEGPDHRPFEPDLLVADPAAFLATLRAMEAPAGHEAIRRAAIDGAEGAD